MPLLTDILFIACAAAIVLLSLAVVLIKNPVRATLLLITAFLPTSLLYILMQAPFVGILQILVYGGAIMMLFTFVIMMINPEPKGGEIPGEVARPFAPLRMLPWLVLLIAAGAVIIPPVYRTARLLPTAAPTKPDFGSLASIADLLFKDPTHNPFTVSFELISFLILVGIIAALNFSRRRGLGRAELNSTPAGSTAKNRDGVL